MCTGLSGTCRQLATQAAPCRDRRRRTAPPSIHPIQRRRPPRSSRRPRDRGPPVPFPAWVRKRQARTARTPEGAGRSALRVRVGQQAPPGGTADAVGGGARRCAGPRAHHVAPGSPGAVAGSPRRPPHSPRGWRKPFSPSAPPCPLTSDLRPHCLKVTPRSRSRGVFINRPPGGSETPDRWIPPRGNGASAHAHPRVHPRLRTEAQRG